MKKEKIEEMSKRGLRLLVESSWVKVSKDQIEIFDKEKMIESKDGKNDFPARGVLRKVRVTKYGENQNGREYGRDLEEKIIKEGTAEGNLSLSGHPPDQGEPDQVVGVWHNYRIDEEGGFADWYLTGSKGQNILEAIQAGGSMGVSRVGFGELSGKKVIAETYELSRLGDAVLEPSQGVFATKENLETQPDKDEKVDPDKDEKKESTKIDEKTDILEEETTNKKKIEENNIEVKETMSDKFLEAALKNTINGVISKAKKNENLLEAITDLKMVDTAGNELYQEKVDTTIDSLQIKLDEQIKDSKKNLDEKTEAHEALTLEHSELKEKYDRVKSIVESNDLGDIEGVNKLKENYDLMSEDSAEVKALFESEELVTLEVANLKDIKDLAEDTVKRDEDIADFKEDIESKTEKLKIAEAHILKCEEKLEELGFKFDEAKKGKKTEMDDEDKDKDEKDDDEEMDEKKKKESKTKKSEMDDEEKDEDEMDEKKSKKKESASAYSFKDGIEKFTEGFEAEEEVSEKDKKSSDKKILTETINKEIQVYYENQIEKFPGLKSIKEDILGSKSLIKAVDMVDEFKENSEDVVGVKVKVQSTPGWFKPGSN